MVFNIQFLRAVAVVLVVISHAVQQTHYTAIRSFALQSGVDIFFVVSGFIMCLISERPISPLNFIIRRLARVAPTYWLVTGAMAILLIANQALFHSSELRPWHLISSFLFIASAHPSIKLALPLYTPGWTLNDEFFFYSMFACFVALPMRPRIAVCSLILVVSSIPDLFLDQFEHPVLSFYTNTIRIEFVFGMFAYLLYRADKTLSTSLAVILLFCAPVLLIGLQINYPVTWGVPSRLLVFGIPSAIAVISMLQLEKRGRVVRNPVCLAVGDASYSIYLTHLFVIGAVAELWHHNGLLSRLPEWALMAACIGLSLMAGLAFYRWVERPLVTMVHLRMIKKVRPTSPEPSKLLKPVLTEKRPGRA